MEEFLDRLGELADIRAIEAGDGDILGEAMRSMARRMRELAKRKRLSGGN